VRHGWLAALAALLFAAPVAAQPAADAGAGAGEAGEAGGEAGGGDDIPPMFRDPRQLSGVARGEANDPAGRLTVRAVQGAMRRTEFGDIRSDFPAGAPVNLISIDSHGEIAIKTIPLDAGGRATFDGLATDGSETYFVLALFKRKLVEDRLLSRLVTMPPQVGMRMILAGEAVDSDKPPVDDLLVEQNDLPVPPAGTVDVYLRGSGRDTRNVREIELLQAGVDKPIQRAKLDVAAVAATPEGEVTPPQDDPALRPGLLEVLVTRGGKGLPGIPVEVAISGAADGTPPARKAETDASGRVLLDRLPAGKKYIVKAPIQGRTFESAEIDPPGKTGQRIKVEVDWRESRTLRARFTGVQGGADTVFLARAADQPRLFVTMPFQLTAAAGAVTDLIVAPPVLFAFHGGATVDEGKLEFQLQISLYNASIAPYRPGVKGVFIPLPVGFKAASVEEEFNSRVKADSRGLTWRGLLPPGEQRFVAGFALPAPDGKASFDMAMPFGLWTGQMVFEQMPGVRIQPPAGAKQNPGRSDDGKPLVVLQELQLKPGERLTMSFAGLPQHAAWKAWARNTVGVIVLGLLGWGIWGVATRTRRGGGRQSVLEEEREELLQSVVQLEADLRRDRIGDAEYQKRRGELLRRLERVYADLGAEERAAEAGASEGETRAGP
jgi:hypothetical protein